MSIFVKIHLVGAELLHTDRWKDGRKDRKTQTDMTKLIVVFPYFANALKNCSKPADITERRT